MGNKGIDHATCPKARVARSLWTAQERAFADVLMKAFVKKVNIFLKVRVLDVIELAADEPDKRRLFFWHKVLGDQHFDYVVCSRETLKPLLAVELDDPTVRRRTTAAEDVKSTAARNAAFPVVRFSAASKLTPELLRQKLIADYRLARAGPLPAEMGLRARYGRGQEGATVRPQSPGSKQQGCLIDECRIRGATQFGRGDVAQEFRRN